MDKAGLLRVPIHVIHDFDTATLLVVRHIAFRWRGHLVSPCLNVLQILRIVVQMSAGKHVISLLISIHILVVCWLFIYVIRVKLLSCLFGLDHATQLEESVIVLLITSLHQRFFPVKRRHGATYHEIIKLKCLVHLLCIGKHQLLVQILIICLLSVKLCDFKSDFALFDLLFDIEHVWRLGSIFINISGARFYFGGSIKFEIFDINIVLDCWDSANRSVSL